MGVKMNSINEGKKEITFTCENALFDQDMFHLLAYGHKEKICKFFLKYPFGISLLRQCSEQELLFLMPNNVKRRLGFPMTRVARRGLHSREYKNHRRKALAYQCIYEWVEQNVIAQFNEAIKERFSNMIEIKEN